MGMISLLFIISLCAVFSFQISAYTWQVDQGSSESVYLKPEPIITWWGYGWRLSILSRGTKKNKGTFSKCFYLFLFILWLFWNWHRWQLQRRGRGITWCHWTVEISQQVAEGHWNSELGSRDQAEWVPYLTTGGLKAGWVTWLPVANASRKPTVILVWKPKKQSSG